MSLKKYKLSLRRAFKRNAQTVEKHRKLLASLIIASLVLGTSYIALPIKTADAATITLNGSSFGAGSVPFEAQFISEAINEGGLSTTGHLIGQYDPSPLDITQTKVKAGCYVSFGGSDHAVMEVNVGGDPTKIVLGDAALEAESTTVITGARCIGTEDYVLRLGGFSHGGPIPSGQGYISRATTTTSGWGSITSATASDSANGQSLFYALTFNGGTTYKIWTGTEWKMISTTDPAIHEEEGSNWIHYNNDGVWTTSLIETEEEIFTHAFEVASNQMTSATLNAITTENWASSGWTEVNGIGIAAYMKSSDNAVTPKLQSITFSHPTQIYVTLSALYMDQPEAAGSFQITATITEAIGVDVTAHLQYGGSAVSGTDYETPPTQIVVPAGQTTASVTVNIIDNSAYEADKLIAYGISSCENASCTTGLPPVIAWGTQGVYRITNDDAPATVSFNSSTTTLAENAGTTSLPLTLSAPAGQTITIPYTVTPGTATGGGTDYTLVDGSITINEGETTGSIPLTIIDDIFLENSETFTVNLGTPSTGASLGATTSTTVTITDNDVVPMIQFGDENCDTGLTPVPNAQGIICVIREGETLHLAIETTKAAQSNDTKPGAHIAITGGTAAAGVNFMTDEEGHTEGDISIDENTTVTLMDIPTIADGDNVNQTMIIDLSSPVRATLGNRTRVTVIIREDDVPSLAPSGLAINGKPSPATTESTTPIFSWRFNAGLTGDMQTGMQTLVATSALNLTNGTYLCDTGRIHTAASSANIGALCNQTLAAGTYHWKVRTYNSAGVASPYSTAASFTIASPLAAPTSCSISSITPNSLTINWTDVATNETGYEIQIGAALNELDDQLTTSYSPLVKLSANAISYDVAGLIPGMPYSFKIRSTGYSDRSSFLTCNTTITLPATPLAPLVSGVSPTSIHAFIQPQEANTVDYAVGVNSSYLQANGTLGGTPHYFDANILNNNLSEDHAPDGFTISNLTPDTAYSIFLIARNATQTPSSPSDSSITYTLAERPSATTSLPGSAGFTLTIDPEGNPSNTLYAVAFNAGDSTMYLQPDGSVGGTIAKQTLSTWGTPAVHGLPSGTDIQILSDCIQRR
jgi:hypothetical protein